MRPQNSFLHNTARCHMATLKEIKGRINTVNGTLKITSAMKMVASAKLHKAQDAMANLIPYERQMHGILCRLLSDESAPSCEEFAAQRQVRKAAIVAVASNSSLCGAFNANVIRLFNETAEGYLASGLTRDDILVFPVGRKMAEAASKAGFASHGDFNSLADKHVFGEVKAFAESLTDKFLRKEVDEVSLVYSHYKSSSSQEPVREIYLPFSAVSSMDVRISGSGQGPLMRQHEDYIIEPDAESVLRALLPKVLVLKIYTMLLDASAAEHASRMVAMQEATDNGNQLLQDLTRQYNRQRQQSITDELLDIVSGSLA